MSKGRGGKGAYTPIQREFWMERKIRGMSREDILVDWTAKYPRTRPPTYQSVYAWGKMGSKRQKEFQKASAYHDDFAGFVIDFVAPLLDDWNGLPEFQKIIVSLLNEKEESQRHLLITLAPGHGKTTMLLAWVCWKICCDRNTSGLYITNSDRNAKKRMRWVKTVLQSNAVISTFGHFKPESGDEGSWAADSIQVAGVTSLQKETTFQVAGAGQAILGNRVPWIIADDIADTKNSRQASDREAMEEWWTKEVQSRLEPEGTLAMLGSRLGPYDIYGFVGNMTDDETLEPIYKWVKLRAHDETKCDGEHKTQYPDGCMLFPARWPWKALMKAKSLAGSGTWRVTYQQEDVAAENALVQKAWLYGGKDSDDWKAPGCLDNERSIGMMPNANCHTGVVTVDPSPSMYWAVEWWLLSGGEKPTWHLFEYRRKKMGANSLLDNQVGTRNYTGILEEWVTLARQHNIPLNFVIVEQNAAQRFLMQFDFFLNWKYSRNVQVLSHNTATNKGDPKLGVWALSNRFREGNIRIPHAPGPTRENVSPLIEEFLNYPNAPTDDCVMAAWFLLYNERKLAMRFVDQGWNDPTFVPEYMKAKRELIDPDNQRIFKVAG